MSQEPAMPPPLPDDLLTLLDAERQRPSPSDADRDLVRQGLDAILAGGGGTGSGPDGSSTPPLGGSTSPRTTTPPLHLPVRYGPTALALAFLLGGGAGALLHSQLAARSETQAQTPSMPIIAPAPSATAPSTDTPSTPVPTTASPPPLQPVVPMRSLPFASAGSPASAAPTPGLPPPLTKDEHLAAERALLDTARSALARGDASAGLAALSRHEAEFPRGQLTEEREALAVQALALAGRRSEAAERAGGFRLHFPHSVLLPVVDQAVGAGR